MPNHFVLKRLPFSQKQTGQTGRRRWGGCNGYILSTCTSQPLFLKNTSQQHQNTIVRLINFIARYLFALVVTSIYATGHFPTIADVPFPLPTDMDAGSQPSLQHQLFESTAVVLDIIKKVESIEIADLGPLEEGLRSLQDTLLGSAYISSPQLDPFYLLCLQLCDAIRKQCPHNDNASLLANVSVTGYDLYQLREVLLALFHALSTYLNVIRRYVYTNSKL